MAESSTCTFTNDRGIELSARLTRPATTPRAVVLFAHCFTCSKDLRVERRLVRSLSAQGFAVLAFDFTGLGRSEGDFAESTFASDTEDLVAAASYLRDEIEAPSLLVGHSLGGAAVVVASAQIPEVRAITTIAAPAEPTHVTALFSDALDDIRERGSADVTIAGRTFTITSEFVEQLAEHRPRAALRDFDGALLIFHSPVDGTVGVDNAEQLYRAARHPKSFVSLDGADHLLTDQADAAYVAAVTAAWADRYLPDAAEAVDETEADESEAGEGEYGDDRVVARNDGGLRTTLRTRGFTLIADEPEAVGGTEQGPTPYEYLGAALASCTSMTLRMYANRAKLPLGTVTTTVTHDRVHATDCEECEHVDGRIDVLRRTVELTGDLDDEQRAKLLDIADRCPVHRTLEGQLEVHSRLSSPTGAPAEG
ncbi:MAG: bifunctional alpha/beta hydrolase/OsmC family protein [Actinobacteria bacterium]|nr:bifunctional alpha/beta hydrolase/OsmC family protein [Actinomycetota bacterium]